MLQSMKCTSAVAEFARCCLRCPSLFFGRHQGNCPGGCSGCPCGTTTAYVNVADWCSKFAGWNQAQVSRPTQGSRALVTAARRRRLIQAAGSRLHDFESFFLAKSLTRFALFVRDYVCCVRSPPPAVSVHHEA